MTPERLGILIDGLVDGWLDAEGRSELFDELRRSPESCRKYWQMLACHHDLLDVAEQERAAMLRDDLDWNEQLKALAPSDADTPLPLTDLTERYAAAERASQTSGPTQGAEKISEAASTAFSFAGVTVSRGHGSGGLRLNHLGIAATLLIASALVVGLMFTGSGPDLSTSDPSTSGPIADAPDDAPAPAIVGRLSELIDAVWRDESEIPSAGHFAYARPYELVSGFVELTFDDGAAVILQGPCVFEPLDRNAVRLDAGRLAASADGPVKGFVVQTPSSRIVDLGTEFVVAVGEDEQTEAYTVRGLIRVEPVTEVGEPGPGVELREGEGARVRVGAGAPEVLAPGRSLLALSNPSHDLALHRRGIRALQGAVKLREDVALADLLGPAVFADHIMLIPEASGLVSATPIVLDAYPLAEHAQTSDPRVIPAGVAFDSYLLYFKPYSENVTSSDPAMIRTAAGRVIFLRQPLGVIYSVENLESFHAAIGDGRLETSSRLARFAIEVSDAGPGRLGGDSVRLGPEVYTVDVRLDAIAADVIRILVPTRTSPNSADPA